MKSFRFGLRCTYHSLLSAVDVSKTLRLLSRHPRGVGWGDAPTRRRVRGSLGLATDQDAFRSIVDHL